jgi:hypothetical protein
MRDPNRLLDDIRIASPCTASWDAMTGDDTARFCGECKLNVYNLSSLTAGEAAALIERAEGRLCVRLYRRNDGTVMTRDCPVGVRAAVRRATRAAGAAMAAILGLFSGFAARPAAAASGQGSDTITCEPAPQEEPPPFVMGKIALPRSGEEISVAVTDQWGAPIADAEVVLTDLGTGETLHAELGEDGLYRVGNVEPGVYSLTATGTNAASEPKTVRVRKGRPMRLEVVLR